MLVEEGLLKKDEIVSHFNSDRYCEYDKLYDERFLVLKKAFHRFDVANYHFQQFVFDQRNWLYDYALFMSIKGYYHGKSWESWPADIRLRKPEMLVYFKDLLQEDFMFYQFVQFKAYEQYASLKSYANDKGIKMIGDMPIYVSYDSSDVWANPEFFNLDEDRIPIEVAGVPPDNFSAEGQLWGNPLYNWDIMKQDDYAWWVDRVKSSMELFDMIRIDHFIGFQNYYAIPQGHKTAVLGTWRKGPGIDIFHAIKRHLGDVNIIAEDLGVITDDVRKLLKSTGFPGMKLLQFAFDSREESDYIPHLYDRNVIAYTGTHDNETTAEWFTKLPEKDLTYCLDYINHVSGNPVDSLIKATLACVADTAIIPMQDWLSLGKEARMNIPSTTGNNWKWRLKSSELNDNLLNKMKSFTLLYGRGYHGKRG
jgi:4-alpha-glucanotransferase